MTPASVTSAADLTKARGKWLGGLKLGAAGSKESNAGVQELPGGVFCSENIWALLRSFLTKLIGFVCAVLFAPVRKWFCCAMFGREGGRWGHKKGENEASAVVVWEFRTKVCHAGRRD